MPWPELTRSAGRALGQVDQADQLVAEVEERFARGRREHPEFEGLTVAYAGVLTSGGYYVESNASPRVGILTALGFTVPQEIDDLAGELTYAELSEEQLQLLDRDILLWEIGQPGLRSAIDGSPVYRLLDVAREGRDVFIEDPLLAAAMAATSALSLPYVIDKLVPMLAAAVVS